MVEFSSFDMVNTSAQKKRKKDNSINNKKEKIVGMDLSTKFKVWVKCCIYHKPSIFDA